MRKTKEVTIAAEGRDKGKRFFITEMSAPRFAEWATRASLAITRGGGNVPAGVLDDGFAGLVAFGLQALASCAFEDARPLLAELDACVQAMPDPSRPGFVRPGGLVEDTADQEGDLQEFMSVFRLRQEVLELHLGFSLAAEWLKYQTALAAERAANSSDTPTSRVA
jgi:hypothetical protein